MTTITLADCARTLYRSVRQAKRHLFRQREGRAILLARYQKIHGKPLPRQPQTFTAKLYHRMLNWHRHIDPKYPWLTDKHSVRAYVDNKIGQEYLPDLYWQGTDQREIPFHRLKADYVIKPTHASQRVLVKRGIMHHSRIESAAADWLTVNYYWHAREAQYYPLTPALVIEECLTDDQGHLPLDYKIWCFHGQPEMIQVINFERDTHSFYSPDWKQLNLAYNAKKATADRPRPAQLETMLEVAAKLSKEFDFVRVDLYNVHGKVYFGELTFTPTAGNMKFQQPEWDRVLGEKWATVL
jgi:hypothetical protein